MGLYCIEHKKYLTGETARHFKQGFLSKGKTLLTKKEGSKEIVYLSFCIASKGFYL